MINTPILTTFDCPAENPLYEDGNWAQTTPERAPMQKVSGGDCRATDSVHGDPNYSHWTRETFDSSKGDVQAWACIEGGQLGDALETWRVFLWNTVGSEMTGYLVYVGGGISKEFAIRRYNGGLAGFTVLAQSSAGYPSRLGIRINGNDIEAWADSGFGWSLVLSATDTTYRGKFYAGIGIEDPTAGGLSMSCFGAGVPRRTQFFRWIFN